MFACFCGRGKIISMNAMSSGVDENLRHHLNFHWSSVIDQQMDFYTCMFPAVNYWTFLIMNHIFCYVKNEK